MRFRFYCDKKIKAVRKIFQRFWFAVAGQTKLKKIDSALTKSLPVSI